VRELVGQTKIVEAKKYKEREVVREMNLSFEKEFDS